MIYVLEPLNWQQFFFIADFIRRKKKIFLLLAEKNLQFRVLMDANEKCSQRNKF